MRSEEEESEVEEFSKEDGWIEVKGKKILRFGSGIGAIKESSGKDARKDNGVRIQNEEKQTAGREEGKVNAIEKNKDKILKVGSTQLIDDEWGEIDCINTCARSGCARHSSD